MIRLENVCKNFGDLQVLKNVNLEVKEGEKLVIIGPSGSGKSTTVRCMNFLEEPTSGHVYIDGQKLTHANKTKIIRESISMVFQQFNLFNNLTILENVTISLKKVKKVPAPAAEEKARALLRRVGLEDKADAYPAQLSGGQKQRLAIACAIFSSRRILILDEPTSGLDGQNMRLIAGRLKSEARNGRTILVITHDRELIESCCDNVVEVEKRSS